MFLSSECSSGQNVHMIRMFILTFIQSKHSQVCSSEFHPFRMSTKLSYVQYLISGSTISCVRFCVDFLQKSFYNLKHLMFGYKKMSLRFNHHVKPELSNQPIPSISHKRLLFSLSPLTVTFLQFPPSQCKLLSFSLPFSFPSARLVYIISNHF